MSEFSLAGELGQTQLSKEELQIIEANRRRKEERARLFEQEQRNNQGLQPLHALVRGAVSSVQSLGSGLKFVGAEETGQAIEGWAEETNQDIYDDMSDKTREAISTPLTVENEDALLGVSLNPDAGWEDFFMGAMEGSGSAIASVAAGGPASAGVKAALNKGSQWAAKRMSREAKALIQDGADPGKAAELVLSQYKVGKFSVPETVAGVTGAAVGFGGTGALMEGGGAASEVEDAVLQLPWKEANQIERFGEIYHQQVEGDENLRDLPLAEKHRIALKLYAREEADRAFDDMAVKAGITSVVAGPMLQKAMLGRSSSVGRGFASGVVAESAEEGYIAGETQQNINTATGRPEDEGVAQARAEGAVRGGMAGGAVSAPNALMRGAQGTLQKADIEAADAVADEKRTKHLDAINQSREAMGLSPMQSLDEFEDRYRVIPGADDGDPFIIYDTHERKTVGHKEDEGKAAHLAKLKNLEHNIARGEPVSDAPAEADPETPAEAPVDEEVPAEDVPVPAEEGEASKSADSSREAVERGEVYSASSQGASLEEAHIKLAEKKAEGAREALQRLLMKNDPAAVSIMLPNGERVSGQQAGDLIEKLVLAGNDGSDILGRMPAMFEQSSIEPLQAEEVESPAAEEVPGPEAQEVSIPEVAEVRMSDARGWGLPELQAQSEMRGLPTTDLSGKGLTINQMLDNLDDFQRGRKVEAAGELRNPADKMLAHPVQALIKRMGGVNPASPIGKELRATDAHSWIFNNEGLGSLDGIVQSEHEEFSLLPPAEDLNGFVDESVIVDLVREELSGNPLRSSRQQEAIDSYQMDLLAGKQAEADAEMRALGDGHDELSNFELDRLDYDQDWGDFHSQTVDLYQRAAQYDEEAADRLMGDLEVNPVDLQNQLQGIVTLFEEQNSEHVAGRPEDQGVPSGLDEEAQGEEVGAVEPAAAGAEGQQEIEGLGSPIDQAAHEAATSPLNDHPEPTDGQKKAGNYKLGPVKVHGLDISIENPKGSVRRGVGRNDKEWAVKLQSHYGYIKGTVGKDKDHVDVFLGDNVESPDLPVFVVDQVDPASRKFDEHKVIMGAATREEAEAIYLSNYEAGWTGLDGITEMPLDEFKAWVKDSKKTQNRLSDADPQFARHSEDGQEGGYKKLPRSRVQLYANQLNTYLSKEPEIGVRHAYEQVDMPDTSVGWVRAFEEALGRKVVFIQPNHPRAKGFINGAYVKGDILYISAEAGEPNFVQVAGHEFLHSLQKNNSDLHRYLVDNLTKYVTPEKMREHHLKLREITDYSSEVTRNELLADFVGDAFNDTEFVKQLAEDNPSKFKSLLNSLIDFFSGLADKLQKPDDRSSKYFHDVAGMRDHLRTVMDAYVNGKSIDEVTEDKPLYQRQSPAPAHGTAEDQAGSNRVLSGFGQGIASGLKRNGLTWRTVKDTIRPGMLWGMTGKQILEVYGGKLRGSLRQYTHLLDQMREEKSRLINRADSIEKRWNRHVDATEIGEILLDGTFNQVDPLMSFDDHEHIRKKREKIHGLTRDLRMMDEMSPDQAYLEDQLLDLETEMDGLKETHAMLQGRYQSLDSSGQRIYQEVRDSYSDGLQEYKEALLERIQRSEMGGKAKVAARSQVELMFAEMAHQVAYFPLKRFGQNIVLAEIDGERHVMKFDRVSDAEAEKNRIVDEGGIAERHTEMDYLKSDNTVTPQFMTDVEAMLEGNGLMSQDLRDSLNQLYLNYLPESSSRKQFMHRNYVLGFSRDAIRSFSHSMFHGAHHMAKIKFADKMQDELSRMEQMTNWKTYKIFASEQAKQVADYEDENAALRAAAEARKTHPDWDVSVDPDDAGNWVVTIKPVNNREEVGSFSTEIEAREARVTMMEKMPESEFTIVPETNPDLASDLKDSESLAHVVNHMKKRHEVLMNPAGSRLANALSGYGFLMYLGFTPAAAMVNMSQTGLVALPQLAARHGWNRAQKALHGYVKDIAVGGHIDGVDDIETDEIMTPERRAELKRIVDGRKETRAIDRTLRTLLTGKKLNNRQRVALMHLYDSGNLDLSQNSNLATVAHNDLNVRMGGVVPMKGVVEASGYLFHNVEVFNREVTGLAAYDLAFEDAIEEGLSEVDAHNRAADAAVEANDRGHFDYSTENRAMLMQSNVARVVTQFKQYSQNMTFRLLRDLHQTFQGESPEDRAVARRQLIGTLGMHSIFAGAAGLPFVTLPMLFNIASMTMGDDDEPVDAEVEFKNFLADNYGQKTAEVVMNGVLRGIPGISAADVSSRISLRDLWIRSSDWDKGDDGEMVDIFKMVMGPQASLWIENPVKAAGHFGRGDYYKGFESITPKVMKNFIKAVRNMNEGERSKAGIVQLDADQFDWVDTTVQMAGFTPTRKSQMYEYRNAVYGKEQALSRRRTDLKNMWVEGKMAGDSKMVLEAKQQITAFNKKNPEMALTERSLKRSLKAKRKRQERTKYGVHTYKNREHLREEGRFARVEEW